jgi:hypothetical protein
MEDTTMDEIIMGAVRFNDPGPCTQPYVVLLIDCGAENRTPTRTRFWVCVETDDGGRHYGVYTDDPERAREAFLEKVRRHWYFPVAEAA